MLSAGDFKLAVHVTLDIGQKGKVIRSWKIGKVKRIQKPMILLIMFQSKPPAKLLILLKKILWFARSRCKVNAGYLNV